jgi:hypothetical protein
MRETVGATARVVEVVMTAAVVEAEMVVEAEEAVTVL